MKPAPPTTEQTPPHIERDGSTVKLILPCGTDYAAMMVYDKLLEQANKGLVVIPFSVQRGC